MWNEVLCVKNCIPKKVHTYFSPRSNSTFHSINIIQNLCRTRSNNGKHANLASRIIVPVPAYVGHFGAKYRLVWAESFSGVPHPFLSFNKFYVTQIVRYACNRQERKMRLALAFPNLCHLSSTDWFGKRYISYKNVTTPGCGTPILRGLTPWFLDIIKRK
jgi:hypothetical protein